MTTTTTNPALKIANDLYRAADLSPRLAEAYLGAGSHSSTLFLGCCKRAGVPATPALHREVRTILAGWVD